MTIERVYFSESGKFRLNLLEYDHTPGRYYFDVYQIFRAKAFYLFSTQAMDCETADQKSEKYLEILNDFIFELNEEEHSVPESYIR